MFWKKTSKSSQHNVSQQFYNSASVQVSNILMKGAVKTTRVVLMVLKP